MRSLRILLAFLGWTLLVAGLLQLAVAGVIAWRSAHWQAKAIRVNGTVVDIRGGRSEFPVITYDTDSGEVLRFQEAMGFDRGTFLIGQSVPLLVDPNDPKQVTMDRPEVTWGLSNTLLYVGGGTVIVGLAFGVVPSILVRLFRRTANNAKAETPRDQGGIGAA